jgi:oligoendopeptidase F
MALPEWDLTAVFADDASALRAAGDLARRVEAFAAEVDAAIDTAAGLDVGETLERFGPLEEQVEVIREYAEMRTYLDAAGPATREVVDACVDAAARAEATLERALDAIAARAAEVGGIEPGPAAHRLQRVARLRARRPSPEAERAWAAREQSARGRWVRLYERTEAALRIDFDDGTGEHAWGLGELLKLLRRPEPELRRAAYDAAVGAYETVTEVVAACWDAVVADRVAEDELRGRAHPAQATLDDDELDLDALETLIDAVWGRLDLRHDLLSRQAAMLGVRPLLVADTEGEPAGVAPIAWEQAWEVAVAALGDVDPLLVDDAQALLQLGRVDVAPRPGRQLYAVTCRTALDPPAYLALWFTGRVTGVTTLGHELGHATALGAAHRSQPALGRGWPRGALEVPSILAEIVTGDRLVLERPSDASAVRVVAARDLSWAVFEAVASCRAELELYAERRAGRMLTPERIRAAYAAAMAPLYPAGVPFGDREALFLAFGWAPWAIGSRFYNYQYAVGALTALALSARRREHPDGFGASYLRFLACGRSVSPAEQLRPLGVELGSPALWHEGLDELERRVADV